MIGASGYIFGGLCLFEVQGGVGVMIGRSGDGVLQGVCRRRVRWKEGWSTRVKDGGCRGVI